MSTYSSNRGFWRGLTLGVAFFGLTLFLNLLTLRPGVRGESIAVSKAEPTAGKPLPKLYFGSKACASAGCHEKGQVTDPPLLCRGDELDRFKAHDRHADAYNAMTGKLGRDILKRLNLGEPQTATDCLACHSVNIEKGATKHESFQLKRVSHKKKPEKNQREFLQSQHIQTPFLLLGLECRKQADGLRQIDLHLEVR